MSWQRSPELDSIHHVAIEVADVRTAVQWYTDIFRCRVAYQDDTWGMLEFGNLSLALVTRDQHLPHIGFVTPAATKHGELKTHRDGTRSIYITDLDGNAVELLPPESVKMSEKTETDPQQ